MKAAFVALVLAALVCAASAFSLKDLGNSLNLGRQDESFEAWAKAHGKNYVPEEVELRRAQYEKTVAMVHENNMKNSGAQFGVHKYADRTTEELKAMFLGYKPSHPAALGNDAPSNDDDGPPDDKPHPFDYAHIDPPAHVDWRKVPNVLGPVKSQHINGTHCGCCWTFATTGVVEAVHGLLYQERVALSEQQLISCDHGQFTKKGIEEDDGCKGGDIRWAMHYIAVNGGIATEEEYPYEAKDTPCKVEVAKKNHRVKITDFHNVPDKDAHAFRQAVSQQPVAIGVSVGDDWLDAWSAYQGGILDPAALDFNATEIDHAMLLVGYGTENGVPYWLLKNSWSDDWGEKGFMKVRSDFEGPEGYGPISMYKDAAYPVVSMSWGESVETVAQVLRKLHPNAMVNAFE